MTATINSGLNHSSKFNRYRGTDLTTAIRRTVELETLEYWVGLLGHQDWGNNPYFVTVTFNRPLFTVEEALRPLIHAGKQLKALKTFFAIAPHVKRRQGVHAHGFISLAPPPLIEEWEQTVQLYDPKPIAYYRKEVSPDGKVDRRRKIKPAIEVVTRPVQSFSTDSRYICQHLMEAGSELYMFPGRSECWGFQEGG